MVRIKHRYLLLNILYPATDPSINKSSQTQKSPAIPDYLHFHAPSPPTFTEHILIRLIRDSILLHFGEHGAGVTNPNLKCSYLSQATSTAIVRCPRAHFRMVWAALTFTTHLPAGRRGDAPIKCVIRVVRVSGTIRKAEEEAMRRARREIVILKALGSEKLKSSEALDNFASATKGLDSASAAPEPSNNDDLQGLEDFDGEDDSMEDDSD